jgi:hypothetical protein
VEAAPERAARPPLPTTSVIAMALAAVPLVVFGFVMPESIHRLLVVSGNIVFGGGQ